ncbi:MAG: glycosyltransferase family 4 protein [Lachnospiraceae bacterium]|nr:glycosyltransferase family 4 protein [Lachnospiraceae bacterium]
MNLLVIAHYQDDGSPYVSFVHSQAVEYVKQGNHVIVIAPTVFGKTYQHLKNRNPITIDNIPIYYVDYLSFSNYGKYSVNNWCGYAAILPLVKKLIKKDSIDMIHAHTIGFDGYLAVKLKKRFHIPVVITTHGTDSMGEINRKKGKYITAICKRADCTVAVSSKLKKLLLTEEPKLNIHVIRNGFYNKEMRNKEKETYTILQAGSLIRRKKVDVTLHALALVLKKYPQVHFDIIGEGNEETRLKQICRDLDIEKSVCFHGYLKNEVVLQYMSKARIFVMPSVNEGFGIVYLEAMSQRCVVIGTRGEGIEDIVENGKNGILIRPDDAEELASHLMKCFSSSEYCEEIADRGFQTSQKLTWESNAKKYIQLFKEIISQ